MDKRSKKIILLSHCILNSNSKSEGYSPNSGIFKELVLGLINNDYGIIQIPCPENSYLGIKRWGMTKEQYDTIKFRNHCRNIISDIISEVSNYIKNGYEVKYIVGIKGSPNCGINLTCSSKNYGGEFDIGKEYKCEAITGMGVFMEEFQKIMLEEKLNINMIELDEEAPENILKML